MNLGEWTAAMAAIRQAYDLIDLAAKFAKRIADGTGSKEVSVL